MGTTELYIYGASGHGKVVLDVATRLGYKIKGFIDDNRNKKNCLDFPVYHLSEIENFNVEIALGIGNNKIREIIYEKVLSKGLKIATLIDINAIVSKYACVNDGTVIFPGAVVNSSAYIGKGVIINTGAIIEHDCIINEFAHISPNAALAGGVKVGKYSQIGIGACVKQNITIGNNAIVGVGAVIVKDVPDNVVVVGNPGRIIRKNE
jgi:sugar O-acyltransferase (sialic acid O-acetyltransferase NeuD family)